MKSAYKTLDLRKEYFHFSAAHFTIFDGENRERLHGHNFRVGSVITGPCDDNGLCFDYVIFKEKLKTLCQELDEYMLLPRDSKYITISEKDGHYTVTHNNKVIYLPVDETIILPVTNITIEELSNYFLDKILEDESNILALNICRIEITVSSGPNQWCSSVWQVPQK